MFFLKGECLKGEVLAWKGLIDEIGKKKYQEIYGKRPPAWIWC
jgi:hypothetical protein